VPGRAQTVSAAAAAAAAEVAGIAASKPNWQRGKARRAELIVVDGKLRVSDSRLDSTDGRPAAWHQHDSLTAC